MDMLFRHSWIIPTLAAAAFIGLLWVGVADFQQKAERRQIIARECSGAEHYADCRARLLDARGWRDPNAVDPQVYVQPVRAY